MTMNSFLENIEKLQVQIRKLEKKTDWIASF